MDTPETDKEIIARLEKQIADLTKWDPGTRGGVADKMEVAVRTERLSSRLGMDKFPDEEGWLEQWNEIGGYMRKAWIRRQQKSGSGNNNAEGPSGENSPDVSSDTVV